MPRLLTLPVSVPSSHPPAPALETFIKRHFQRKGARPRGGAAVASGAGAAHEQGPAPDRHGGRLPPRWCSGAPLALQGCLHRGCEVAAQRPGRRSAQHSAPACNPRFAVESAHPAAAGRGGAPASGGTPAGWARGHGGGRGNCRRGDVRVASPRRPARRRDPKGRPTPAPWRATPCCGAALGAGAPGLLPPAARRRGERPRALGPARSLPAPQPAAGPWASTPAQEGRRHRALQPASGCPRQRAPAVPPAVSPAAQVSRTPDLEYPACVGIAAASRAVV